MSDTIVITVLGKAEPAGSKKSMPVYGKGGKLVTTATGRPIINTIDDNDKSKSWKQCVALAARQAYRGPLIDAPLKVSMMFFVVRPKGHYNTKRALKGSSAMFPTKKPDVLKLARGVEDALTGVVWRDDAQIVQESLRKDYGEPARVEITITPLD